MTAKFKEALDAMKNAGDSAPSEVKEVFKSISEFCEKRFNIKCFNETPDKYENGSKKNFYVPLYPINDSGDRDENNPYAINISVNKERYWIFLNVDDTKNNEAKEKYAEYFDKKLEDKQFDLFAMTKSDGIENKLSELKDKKKYLIDYYVIGKSVSPKDVPNDDSFKNKSYEEQIKEAIGKLMEHYDELSGKKTDNKTPQKESPTKEDFSKNMILYGPPGTGKTRITAAYAAAICKPEKWSSIVSDGKIDTDYIEENYNNIKKDYENLEGSQVKFITFHQSYGYEDFIEGIKPVIENNGAKGKQKNKQTGGDIKYEIAAGVFKEFCEKARGKSGSYVFIIDEINRGNISKIFGELITLIEESRREGQGNKTEVTLPYSKESFSVPDNVYIIGTMNTADRSIAMLDTALRRRFEFVEMMPDPNVLKVGEHNEHNIKIGDLDVTEMFTTINDRIEVLLDREHTIGHAYFMDLKNETNDNKKFQMLQNIFENKIIPLLQEYFYDDYEKIRLVLGDNDKSAPKFIEKTPVQWEEKFNGKKPDRWRAKETYEITKKDTWTIDSFKEISKK